MFCRLPIGPFVSLLKFYLFIYLLKLFSEWVWCRVKARLLKDRRRRQRNRKRKGTERKWGVYTGKHMMWWQRTLSLSHRALWSGQRTLLKIMPLWSCWFQVFPVIWTLNSLWKTQRRSSISMPTGESESQRARLDIVSWSLSPQTYVVNFTSPRHFTPLFVTPDNNNSDILSWFICDGLFSVKRSFSFCGWQVKCRKPSAI